jgi:hypothetical protein
MQERENDARKWSDLATDSEAEEAQKAYFLDNLNRYYFLVPSSLVILIQSSL